MTSRRFRPTLIDLEGRIVLSDLGVILPVDLDPTTTLTTTAAPATDAEASTESVNAAPSLVTVGPDEGATDLAGSTSFRLWFDPSVDTFTITPSSIQIIPVSPTGATGTMISSSSEIDPADPTGQRILVTTTKPLAPGAYQVRVIADSPVTDLDGNPLTEGSNPVVGQFDVEAPAMDRPVNSASESGSDNSNSSNTPTTPTPVVTKVAVDHWNAASGQATGVTLTFSAPVNPASFVPASGSGLMLEDLTGKTWSLTAFQTNPSHTSLTLIFDEDVPAGTYQIRVAPGTSPVDAQGVALTGVGGSADLLGSVTIAGGVASDPTDLGTLWDAEGSSVGTTVAVGAGQTVTRTFTSFADGSERLSVFGLATGWEVVIRDVHGSVVSRLEAADATYNSFSGNSEWSLVGRVGSYTIEVTNQTNMARVMGLDLQVVSSHADSLLNLGVDQRDMFRSQTVSNPVGGSVTPGSTTPGSSTVGSSTPGSTVAAPTPPTPPATTPVTTQTPASSAGASNTPAREAIGNLNVGPTILPSHNSTSETIEPLPTPSHASGAHAEANFGPIWATPATARGSSESSTVESPSASSESAAASSSPATAAPGESLLSTALSAGLPIGMPTSAAERISVVGPTETSGSFTLASNRQGLSPGLAGVATSNHGTRRHGNHGPLGRRGTTPVPTPADDAAAEASLQATGDVASRSLDRDTRAVADTKWIGQLTAVVVDTVGGSPRVGGDPGDASTEVTVASRPGSWAGDGEHVEYASLSSPVVVIGSALALYRVRFEIRKRGRQAARAALHVGRSLFPRPLGPSDR